MAEGEVFIDLKSMYPPVEVEERAEPMGGFGEARLVISHIDNENFKSYGGLRTLGPFHNNFTCIIGPNGSGKSNVIDALLFVFGFKASKIRIKKLSVLIHKSELFPNVQSCTVKVFFQRIIDKEGIDNFEIVENSQFVVSRTAYKDNTSVYKINDKKVGTKEVADFLKRQGIDLDHNRFLILQGEVEQISLMKPKAATEHDDGLLEYLEDIIGSNRFKNPINILYKRLDELCELRLEKLNRVKVVEKEKKELEGVRNEAIRYLRLCNEITIRKNIAFQIKCEELKTLEGNAKEKVDSCKQEMEAILQDIEKVCTLKQAKEKSVKEIVQQHMMKMQEFEQSKKRFKELELEDATLRDSRKHCKLKLEETKKKINAKQNEFIKFENVPSESVSRIEQLIKEIKELEKLKQNEVMNQETAQSDLKEETKELQEQYNKKAAILLKEEELLLEQDKKIHSIKCERDLFLNNLTKDEEKLSQIEMNLKSLRDTVNGDKQNLERLIIDLPKMEKDYQSLINQIENNKKDFQTVEAELNELQQHLDSGSSFDIGEKMSKFLFDQQSKGNLKNIIGRLGDLASVDVKYDIALSTACGRLDNIVTETIDDAQRCVELMKKNSVGKSTFIALEKVDHWLSRANIPFQAPRNIPRAFDLLKMQNERYRSVFYFAFHDLLVSQHIHEAREVNNLTRINYRIVTLKGDIIDISGAMTGGGNRIIQGKICTNANKVINLASNINKAEIKQKYEAMKYKHNQLVQLIGQLSQKRDSLQKDIEESRGVQNDCKKRLKSSQEKETSLLVELEAIKKNIKSMRMDDAKFENINKTVQLLNITYGKDLAKFEKMKEVVNKLQEEITNMGIAKLGCIKSRLDAVGEKIKEKTGTLKKINLSVKNAEKICNRATAEIEEFLKQKSELEAKVIEMDETLTDLDVRAATNVEKYQKINRDVDELAKIKIDREKELTDICEEFKKLDCSKKQTQRLLDERQEKLNQISSNISQIKGNIDKLKLFKVSDDQDEDESFMELIGESGDDMVFYSNQSGGNSLRTYSEEELAKFHVQKIGFQDLEDKVNRQKPNLTAIEEYRLKEEIYMERAAELTTVTELRDSQRRQAEQMKKQRLDEFLSGFNLITGKLKEMYQLITMGGDAELELVDTLDPFSEGIVFSVRPPKKSWKNISNLSGGEKTLSSLALVFALHHFKPTPFYVMDEIDAALDFKNVSIVANYIKERTKNAQFIIISLRNNMYELADRLVGICKPFNFTKTCVLNPKCLEKYLSAYNNVPVVTKFPLSQNLVRPIQFSQKVTTQPLDVDIDTERENDTMKIC